MNPSASDRLRSYLHNRHDRSMIRLCALLWILKIQEDCYEKRRAQNRHQGVHQPLDSQNLLGNVAMAQCQVIGFTYDKFYFGDIVIPEEKRYNIICFCSHLSFFVKYN